jgi:hypothetical protein
VLDPGFGFGKTLDHNLVLFRQLDSLAVDDLPLLLGVSRKSMLGAITGRPVDQRLAASISAALVGAQKGAKILRVHDVEATRMRWQSGRQSNRGCEMSRKYFGTDGGGLANHRSRRISSCVSVIRLAGVARSE